MPKMTIDKLAEMTQEEFSHVYEKLDGMDEKLNDLQSGQKRILDVLLEIPSKKAFGRFQTQVNARLASVEEKVAKTK